MGTSLDGRSMKDEFKDSLYTKLPNLVLDFHGCKEEVFNRVLHSGESLLPNTNAYDWLGHGIYFWENSFSRAQEWASKRYKENGRVIGAILDLGNCLNFTDYSSLQYLKLGFNLLRARCELVGMPLPANQHGKSTIDFLERNLDCAVIQELHSFSADTNEFPSFDSVRGVFNEGIPPYPGACFWEKTHIQICVINPNCIKGYFKPLYINSEYPNL